MIQTGKYLHPGENDLNMCLSLSQNGLKQLAQQLVIQFHFM